MQLSRKEKDVIFLSQMQAHLPISQMEELKSYKEYSVRYHLQRCRENKVIVPRTFINLNLLGLNQYEIYFSLSSENRQKREAIIGSLKASENISWLGQVGGDFQYGINIAARNIADVASIIYSLSSRFGASLMERVIAERLSFKYFGNKCLSKKKRKTNYLSYGTTNKVVEIDELDQRILSAITQNGERSSRLLARQLSVPQTTIDYRLRKLEQNGVIVGYYNELQSASLGLQTFILLVCMKNIQSDLVEKFSKFCEQHQSVVILIHSLGSWDFEIGIEVESASEATYVVEELYDFLGTNLNWIRTLPAFANLKVMEYPFVKQAK